MPGGVLPGSAAGRRGGGAASPRHSIASDAFDNTFGEGGESSDWGGGSVEGGYVGGQGSRTTSIDESGAPPRIVTPTPPPTPPVPPPPAPPAADDHLPKPAHLIKAEMGVQIGKEGARDMIVVSLADDVEAVATEWCAARGISEKAKSKVVISLRTRLDAALAQAYQEQQEAAAAARAPPNDVC